MAKEKLGTGEILSTFFDDGAYTPLLSSGAAEAAHGCVGGQPVYAVCQNGGALTVKDVEKQINIIEDLACNPEKLCQMENNFRSVPIEYNAKRLAEMVIDDARRIK